MKTYYAHSKLDYGTKRESDDITWMTAQGMDVNDPNSMMGELGAMLPYLQAVVRADSLVLRCHKGLYVGKGAFHEVCEALAHNKLARVFQGKTKLTAIKGIMLNDQTDWKVKYGKIIT